MEIKLDGKKALVTGAGKGTWCFCYMNFTFTSISKFISCRQVKTSTYDKWYIQLPKFYQNFNLQIVNNHMMKNGS